MDEKQVKVIERQIRIAEKRVVIDEAKEAIEFEEKKRLKKGAANGFPGLTKACR